MTEHNPAPRLSVALALEQVKESSNATRKLAADLDYVRKERNRYIKDALDFVSVTQLMRVTGLSRDMLYRIKNSPDD